MAKLTIEYLRECFDYDPLTGVIRWRRRPRSHFKTDATWKISITKSSGKVAGCITNYGYLVIGIAGKRVLAHRVAWALIKGINLEELPAEIDHRNTVRDDNSELNLRPATRSQNNRNTVVSSSNTSGYKGVAFDKQRGLWKAYIMKDRKNYHLGFFDSAEDAAVARETAQPLHGEFARLSFNDNFKRSAAA